jgi:hypothetical protein
MDGVIHCAYIHDFTNIHQSGVIDEKAIKAMGEALNGSNKPLIVTTGGLRSEGNEIITEESLPNVKLGTHRTPGELATLELASGVRAMPAAFSARRP